MNSSLLNKLMLLEANHFSCNAYLEIGSKHFWNVEIIMNKFYQSNQQSLLPRLDHKVITNRFGSSTWLTFPNGVQKLSVNDVFVVFFLFRRHGRRHVRRFSRTSALVDPGPGTNTFLQEKINTHFSRVTLIRVRRYPGRVKIEIWSEVAKNILCVV